MTAVNQRTFSGSVSGSLAGVHLGVARHSSPDLFVTSPTQSVCGRSSIACRVKGHLRVRPPPHVFNLTTTAGRRDEHAARPSLRNCAWRGVAIVRRPSSRSKRRPSGCGCGWGMRTYSPRRYGPAAHLRPRASQRPQDAHPPHPSDDRLLAAAYRIPGRSAAMRRPRPPGRASRRHPVRTA